MATQDDALVLAARIKDEFSGPARDMAKAIHNIQDMVKGAHTEGSKGAKEQAEKQKQLNESFTETGRKLTEFVTPAMAGLGLSVFGAGEAIGKLVERLKSVSEGYLKLQGATMRTGMNVPELEAYSRTLSHIAGISVEQANEQWATLGDTLAKLRRGYSPEYQRLAQEFAGLGPLINKMATESAPDAAKEFIKFFTSVEATPDQRRKLLAAVGLSPEFANATSKEIMEQFELQEKYVKAHPPLDLEQLKKIHEAFEGLSDALDGLGDDFLLAFGPESVGAIGYLADKISGLSEELKALKQVWDAMPTWMGGGGKATEGSPFQPLPQIGTMEHPFPEPAPDKFSPASRLAGGYRPISFETGGGGDAETVFSRGVHTGTLAALQEWYASLQAGGSIARGGGGIVNASLGGSGSAGGGRGWGGGGYDVMPNDPTGGAGAGGKPMPGGGPQPAPGGADNTAGGGGDGSSFKDRWSGLFGGGGGGGGINREKWRAQLDANPALKEELFRRSLGENRDPQANQAVMEEAANRADIRGNKGFGEHGNLTYFEGRYGGRMGDLSPKTRAMLEANYDKVFRQGSDISKGAIDNSSQGLAYVHEHGGQSGRYGRPGLPPGRFRTTANFGGDRITGHPGVESFEVPGWGDSGSNDRANYPAFRAGQERDMLANAGAAGVSGGTHKVEGDAHVKVAFENAPPGAKAFMKYGGLFKSGNVDWGHAMPASNPGGGASFNDRWGGG